MNKIVTLLYVVQPHALFKALTNVVVVSLLTIFLLMVYWEVDIAVTLIVKGKM